MEQIREELEVYEITVNSNIEISVTGLEINN
jgi:hypothetical protein